MKRNFMSSGSGVLSVFCLTALALLSQPVVGAAQDLHLYYDLFTDSMSYQKDGRPIAKPKIKKGDFIVLHFTEFNPYLYQGDVDIEQNNGDDWSGGASAGALGQAPGLSSIIPMLGGAGGAGMPGPLSFFDIPLVSMGENSLKLRDFFSNSRGPAQVIQEAQVQLQALSRIQAEMTEIYEAIQNFERSEQAARLASRHIDQLLMNPRMKPSLIRKIAGEYLKLIFPDKSVDALQLDDAFNWQQRPAVKRRLLQDLQNKQREFDTQLLHMAPISEQLSNLDASDSPALEEFSSDLGKVVGQGKSLRQQLEAYLKYQSQQPVQEISLEDMMALQLKFREIADQSFSYDVAISVEKVNVIVTGSFQPLDSLVSSAREVRTGAKIKTIKLQAHGGMRVNTGFGIGFGHFFDPAQEFSAREQTIVADKAGAVQPSLTTFLHFYPARWDGFALAGTFGVGIPLSGGNVGALNFYLGPSLLFGRSQRIVLSGGLTTGPVQRLAKGFQVGDPFDPSNGDIPTQTRYELGYFLGISFNLGG